MSKIPINTAAEIVKKHEPDAARVRKIIEEMNLAAQPEPEEEKAPPVKKQWVVLVSDPNGVLPASLDLVAWVLQIPEVESVATTQDRIFRGVYDFNATKKGRLHPVKTVGEALEHVGSKFFKEADLWVKTKTPVLVVKTDNEIPDGSDRSGELVDVTISHAGKQVFRGKL